MFKQIFSVTVLLVFALNAQAELVNNDPNNLVTNGSFTDVLKNGDTISPGVPTGWEIRSNNGGGTNTPDTMDQTANFGRVGTTGFAAAPEATPDGGTWVGLGRDANKPQFERIGQIVSGFNIGSDYTISWYEGNFGYNVVDPEVDFLNANAIRVNIGDDYEFDGAYIPTQSKWETRSFTFQAYQSSYDVSFGLRNGARSYLSIDGVSITAVTAVPEPSTYAMLLAGGLLIAGFRRNQHS